MSKSKLERFQMSMSQEQLAWLRQYMVDNAINSIQDALRHVVDRSAADAWDLDQNHKKLLREYMAENDLDTIPDAVRHLVQATLNPPAKSPKRKAGRK